MASDSLVFFVRGNIHARFDRAVFYHLRVRNINRGDANDMWQLRTGGCVSIPFFGALAQVIF